MDTLKAIKQWLSENAPKVLEESIAPATEDDIVFVELETGIKLPETFKNFLLIQNGANGANPLFGDGHELLACDQIVKEYHYGRENHELSADDLQQYQEWKEMAAENRIDISGPVKPHESHPNWLPISNQNGDILRYLDFDPAEGGKLGQVIEVDLLGVRWEVIAPSFEDFLSNFYNELINEHFEVDDFGGIVKKEEFYSDPDIWSVPDWLLAVSDDAEYETGYDDTKWHLALSRVPSVIEFLSSEFPIDMTLHEWQDYMPSKIDSNYYDLTWQDEKGLFIAFCAAENFSEIASKIKQKSEKMHRVKLKFTLVKHADPGDKKSHPKWKCWIEATNVQLIG